MAQGWEYAVLQYGASSEPGRQVETTLYLSLPNAEPEQLTGSTVVRALNVLGANGWEVVASSRSALGVPDRDTSSITEYVLKRALTFGQ